MTTFQVRMPKANVRMMEPRVYRKGHCEDCRHGRVWVRLHTFREKKERCVRVCVCACVGRGVLGRGWGEDHQMKGKQC